MKKKILLGLLAIFILIQFFRIDKTNPVTDPAQDFLQLNPAPAKISQLIKRACYDCHSHQTVYPWYSNIAPVSWWLKGHIDHAREHLNFSIWSSYDDKKAHHKLEECYEEVENEYMPLKSYTWMHSESRLTDAQRAELVAWFKEKYEGMGEVE